MQSSGSRPVAVKSEDTIAARRIDLVAGALCCGLSSAHVLASEPPPCDVVLASERQAGANK